MQIHETLSLDILLSNSEKFRVETVTTNAPGVTNVVLVEKVLIRLVDNQLKVSFQGFRFRVNGELWKNVSNLQKTFEDLSEPLQFALEANVPSLEKFLLRHGRSPRERNQRAARHQAHKRQEAEDKAARARRTGAAQPRSEQHVARNQASSSQRTMAPQPLRFDPYTGRR